MRMVPLICFLPYLTAASRKEIVEVVCWTAKGLSNIINLMNSKVLSTS